jgi:hypothetical protein
MTTPATVPPAFQLDVLDPLTVTSQTLDFFAVPSSIKDGELYQAILDLDDIRKSLKATIKYTTTKTGERKLFIRFDHHNSYAISATFTVPVLSADPAIIPPAQADITQLIMAQVAFLQKYWDPIGLHHEIPGNVSSE